MKQLLKNYKFLVHCFVSQNALIISNTNFCFTRVIKTRPNFYLDVISDWEKVNVNCRLKLFYI